MKRLEPVNSGEWAENLAAEYLIREGFKILDRNWRNRWCEIDIIAQKGKVIHFVEVKYRKTAEYGSGFEYITRDKQNRLSRAAEMWVTSEKFSGEYQIDVISVSGNSIEMLENALA